MTLLNLLRRRTSTTPAEVRHTTAMAEHCRGCLHLRFQLDSARDAYDAVVAERDRLLGDTARMARAMADLTERSDR